MSVKQIVLINRLFSINVCHAYHPLAHLVQQNQQTLKLAPKPLLKACTEMVQPLLKNNQSCLFIILQLVKIQKLHYVFGSTMHSHSPTQLSLLFCRQSDVVFLLLSPKEHCVVSMSTTTSGKGNFSVIIIVTFESFKKLL